MRRKGTPPPLSLTCRQEGGGGRGEGEHRDLEQVHRTPADTWPEVQHVALSGFGFVYSLRTGAERAGGAS